MKVVVIGAGPSGLCALKELLQHGYDATCYEASQNIGGTFSAGDNWTLTLSTNAMCFSDYMPFEKDIYLSRSAYLSYLQEYCRTFNLLEHIELNSTVSIAEERINQWHLKIVKPVGELVAVADAVVFATGANSKTRIPSFLAGFTGEIMGGAVNEKDIQSFSGKSVAVFGLGESSADSLAKIAPVAETTLLVMTTKPVIIPRLEAGQLGSVPNNASTSRVRHSNCYSWGQGIWTTRNIPILLLTMPLLLLVWLCDKLTRKTKIQDELGQPEHMHFADQGVKLAAKDYKIMDEWEANNPLRYIGFKFSVKSASFMPHISSGKIRHKISTVASIEGKTITFSDGEPYTADVVLVQMGYTTAFPYLAEHQRPKDMRMLLHHVYNPEIGLPHAFIGWARPATGGVPICSEMASRHACQLLRNWSSLTICKQKILEDAREEKRRVGDSERIPSLVVSSFAYLDKLAKEVGCMPNLWNYTGDPYLLIKIVYGGLVSSQYRLEGPHTYEKARVKVKAAPMSFGLLTQFALLVQSFGIPCRNVMDLKLRIQ